MVEICFVLETKIFSGPTRYFQVTDWTNCQYDSGIQMHLGAGALLLSTDSLTFQVNSRDISERMKTQNQEEWEDTLSKAACVVTLYPTLWFDILQNHFKIYNYFDHQLPFHFLFPSISKYWYSPPSDYSLPLLVFVFFFTPECLNLVSSGPCSF